MTQSKLHKFDHALCDYVAGSVQQYFDDEPEFVKQIEADLCPKELFQYLVREEDNEPAQRLLLNDYELWELADCIENLPPIGDIHQWLPYKMLHRRHVECVSELKAKGTKAMAETWTKLSEDFASQLEKDGLLLAEGIYIVKDWLYELRRYLKTTQQLKLVPRPEGSYPTPTSCGIDDKPDNELNQEDIDLVLKAIEDCGKDKEDLDKPTKVILKAVNKQKGYVLKILRMLEKEGKYNGFERKQRGGRPTAD